MRAREDAPAAAPAACRLAWTDDAGGVRAFTIGARARVTIGRGSRCDLVVRDTRISRHHATIEAVDGQHLLRDAGSANGTYLNGLRLTAGSAFALRSGDVIEIGGDRFAYAGPDVAASTPFEENTRFVLEDLLADGANALSVQARSALDLSVHRALAGVPFAEGLRGVLALVSNRLGGVSSVAFLEDEKGHLRAAAGRPSLAAGSALLSLAARAIEKGEGRLHFAAVPLDEVGSDEETQVERERSSAAVPFVAGARRGALAVQRSCGERLDVRTLALLATMGRAVGGALA